MTEKGYYADRLRAVMDAKGLNIADLGRLLDVPRSTFVGWLEGKTVSIGILKTLETQLSLNLDWFLTGEGDMFLADKPKVEPKDPVMVALERLIEQKIDARLAELKAKHPPLDEADLYVSEAAPDYGSTFEEVAFMQRTAAGPPRPQAEDMKEFVKVPACLIKTKPEDYYAVRIEGDSMTNAGIPNGSLVLLRSSEAPIDGKIQLVRSDGLSTLKRVRKTADGWRLCYEDRTNRYIALSPDKEYQVQGDFVAVVPER
jgi:SOS-response transcriptional repressor LexA